MNHIKPTYTTEQAEGKSGEIRVSSHHPYATSTNRSSEETYSSSRQPCAALSAEIGGAAWPSTSPEAILPAADISISSIDGDTDIVCVPAGKRKRPACQRISDSNSDSSDSPCERKKRVKRLHRHARSRRGVTDSLLYTPEAQVEHTFSIFGRGYESELDDDDDDEREGFSVQESTHYLMSESGGNSDCEMSRETDMSQEICNSCPQSVARPTAEDLSSDVEIIGRSEEEDNSSGQVSDASTASVGGAASPSTSAASVLLVPYISISSSDEDSDVVCLTNSKRKGPPSRPDCGSRHSQQGISEEDENSPGQARDAPTASVGGAASPSTSLAAVLPALDLSGGNNDGDSEKCPICLVTFRAQEVGTPDTCDHFFCTDCLLAWSANANTCPVDRQEFSTILVRHYPHGEVIRRISVSPIQIQYEDFTCVLCGDNDSQNPLIDCEECGYFFHAECIISTLNMIHLAEWVCPICSDMTPYTYTD
jgi:hypothetical protein